VAGKATAAIAGDAARYIEALRAETSHFDVQGLKFGDNRAYRFPIDEFYIPLTTSSSIGADAAKRGEMRAGPVPLQEALLAHRRLLVVGDPGAGKSTFLKRVAFQLCNEYATGGPLPVRIEAAVLSTYIAQQHTKTGPADASSPDWIPVFLGAQCEEKNCGLRADYFRAKLEWLAKQRAKPGRMPAGECLLRLRELALAMQNHEEGRQRQVTLAWAGEKLAGRFANREAAERFLRAEQADSGIVVSRGKEIAYWHLTFQEYLAALEIAGWEDAEQYKLLLDGGSRIYRPEWRETALLYGGLLHNMGPRKVDALLRKVLDKMASSRPWRIARSALGWSVRCCRS